MTKTLEALLESTGRTMAEISSGEVSGKRNDDMTAPMMSCSFQQLIQMISTLSKRAQKRWLSSQPEELQLS
jgi:hypothetical protein